MVKGDNYDINNDTLFIPIDTISGQGNTSAPEYGLTFDNGVDFLIKIHGSGDSHIYVDRYYDAFYYHFIESRILSDFPLEDNVDVKNSGVFNNMRMCYGYHLTVKGTNEEVPDKVYETGKLLYGNGNPELENYASLSDFCFGYGCVEIRIPWQLLNVMDPSSRQQIGDFREEQVITAQDYEYFNFGFAYESNNTNMNIQINGVYSYTSWNMPKWHERLKPAYYELQDYLAKYNTDLRNGK